MQKGTQSTLPFRIFLIDETPPPTVPDDQLSSSSLSVRSAGSGGTTSDNSGSNMIPEPQFHHAERQSDNDDANSCQCLASLSRAARSILAHFRREVDKPDYGSPNTSIDDNSSMGGDETASTSSGGTYHTAPVSSEPHSAPYESRSDALAALIARSNARSGTSPTAQKDKVDEETPLLPPNRAQETK
jgi:hypothetical protein